MRKFEGCFEVVWNVALRDVLRFLSVVLRLIFEVLRLFEGYFEVVSSVALRVVLSVVLRLFEGCFEVVLRLF